MRKIFLLTFFLLIGVSVKFYGQCDWKPLGPSDTNQVNYNQPSDSRIVIDAAGTPYIVHAAQIPPLHGCNVKKYNGSAWVAVGNENFSSGSVAYTDIAIDAGGTLYVSYKDFSAFNKCTVKKYNGTSWVNVGTPGFSANSVDYTSIAIDPSGVPYVAYKDGYVATVKKFNGTSWVNVGAQGFSAGQVNYIELAIDATGTPYVVYEDLANSSRATVMKYIGTAWINVGSAGFSAGQVDYTGIAIDVSGTPYVSYNDVGNGSKATVMKYNGSLWVNVGNAGFSAGLIGDIKITLDASGTPFVVFNDGANNGTTVMKYNGSNWIYVGTAGFSSVSVAFPDIAIDPSGVLYTSYVTGSMIDVKKFNGTSWISLVNLGITSGFSKNVSLAIDNNNTPYLAYKDYVNGGKCSVMKYINNVWVNVGVAGFSPGTVNRIDIAIDNNGTPYILFDYMGAATVMKYNGLAWVTVGSVGFIAGSSSSGYNIEIDNTGMPCVVYNRVVAKFNGTSWINLSTTEFSNWAEPKIAIDNNNTIYIVGLDGTGGLNNEVSVNKYNGSVWVGVGSPTLSTASADYPDIMTDHTGTPYVTYIEDGTHDVKVLKYNGTAWVNCGYTATKAYDGLKMALDNSGLPYIVYSDVTPGIDSKASVKKYNGTSWVTLGSAGFTAGQIWNGSANDIALAIDNSNNVYSVFSCTGTWAFKYNGTSGTANNSSICVGSSILLNATGGTSGYSWAGPNGFTSSIASPTITNSQVSNSGTYSVTITDGTCINIQTVSVTVDNTCSDVWPGDANSDGVADNLDVLELGLHYTQTGTPRSTTSNNWQSYFANNWTGTITNGKNLNHSDCNGDGIIDDNDTLAIYTNYGLTHAFKPVETNTVSPQLSIVPDQTNVLKGTWGTASIYLGDATATINNINGVAFTVNFDNTLIEANNIYIEYQNSFIDAGQNLDFRKLDFANEKIYTATTHTVNNNVSGYGKIATLHYQIKSTLTSAQVLNLGLSQANQSNASGIILPLTTGTGSLTATIDVGLQEFLNNNFISVIPNPTNGLLTINSKIELQKIEVMSVEGKVLLIETPTNVSHTLYLQNFSNGIYFVNVYQYDRIVKREKIVLNK